MLFLPLSLLLLVLLFLQHHQQHYVATEMYCLPLSNFTNKCVCVAVVLLRAVFVSDQPKMAKRLVCWLCFSFLHLITSGLGCNNVCWLMLRSPHSSCKNQPQQQQLKSYNAQALDDALFILRAGRTFGTTNSFSTEKLSKLTVIATAAATAATQQQEQQEQQ